MAAQRKKGKNSQKAKSAKPGPATGGEVKPAGSTSDKATITVDAATPAAAASPAKDAAVAKDADASKSASAIAPTKSKGTSAKSGSKAGAAAAQAEPNAPATDAETSPNVSMSGYTFGVAGEVSTDSASASKTESASAESSSSLVPNSAAADASSDASLGMEAAISAATVTTSAPPPVPKELEFNQPSASAAAPVDEPTAAPKATLTESKSDATAPPAQQVPGEEAPAPESLGPENFAKSEIRTLLVPVKPVHRLIACAIVLFCFSILGHIVLKAPAGVNAHGMHIIDLPEPGCYVFFFRGDLEDPYGWARDGRFRNSLEIEMDTIEPFQKVVKVDPIKDISAANTFSVAEFEVNQPGKYNLWIKWNKPQDRCKGKIFFEKDPVEKFFVKWALGIVGTIALFFMVGIPMTTSKAQSTLPGQKPPA